MNTQTNRLYRSRTNRMIGGVCAGIGDYLNIDPTVIRVLFVLLGFATAGTAIIIYIILMFVVPEEPAAVIPPQPAEVVPPVEDNPQI